MSNPVKSILAARSHMGADRESVEHDPDDLAMWDGLTEAADRLQRAEEQIRQVRELADYLQVARDEGKIQRDDPWKPDSVIKQLRAIVDTGRGEGGEG